MGQKVGSVITKVIAEGLIYNMDPANRSSFNRRGGFPPYGSVTPLPNGILKNTTSNPGHIFPNGTLSGSMDYSLRQHQPRFINNVYNHYTQTNPYFNGLVELYGGNDFGVLEYYSSYTSLGMFGQDQDDYLNNQKLTLSGWCKLGGSSGGSISSIFGYRGSSIGSEFTNRGVGLYRLSTNNTLIFQLGDENTSNVGNLDGDWSYSNSRKTNAFPLPVPTLSPTTFTWVYIAGTWDGESAKIYINGALANTATPPSTLTIDYSSVVLSGIGGNGAGTNLWKGQIGPVQIYNRALTPNEVLHNFNALKGRFDLT
jgi:hypothetical protein